MDNREDIIDMEVVYKNKWEKFKSKAKDKKDKFVNWVKDDPRKILAIGSVVVVGGKKLYDGIKHIQPTQAELDRRWHETHIYDRSTGMYYEIKRPMSANEAMMFSQRKARGELTGDILMSMRLLK